MGSAENLNSPTSQDSSPDWASLTTYLEDEYRNIDKMYSAKHFDEDKLEAYRNGVQD